MIYGGGTTGIMGAVASTLVALSGPSAVHGVIPMALAHYEESATGRTISPHICPEFGQRTVVRDMHARKRLMVQSVLKGGPGSGFVALSGGLGTMEELLEITTWHQIGIHDLNVVAFNVDGLYDGLLSWIKHVGREGFIGDEDAEILGVARTADEVIAHLNRGTENSRKHLLNWV